MDRQAYLDKKNKSHGSESQEIWGQGEKLASQALTQRQALRSNEEAFLASQNERRRKRGLNLNVNNGRIYTFSPLSKSELENSLSWADSEISKLKASGGADGVAGSILKSLGKVSGPLYEKLQKNDNINSIEAFLLAADDFGQKSEKISELEAYKNTVQQYMDNIQFQEDIDKIKSDKYAENKFGAIFNIDNDKKLYFLNAGEEGYDNDFYYERSSRRDKLINELQEMGYDDIERYIKNYSDYRSDKTITPILEYISDSIVEHPVIGGTAATASNILISPMRGVGQTFDSIAEALGIHGYKAASLPAAASQVTTETVHNVINETFDNKHAAGFVRTLYNAAVSVSESRLAMGTFGKLGEAVLGLGAAADTYSQARERGLSDGQALMNGIAAGIFETLFEHLSLEKLRAFKVAPAASVKDFIKTVVFQAGIEGSEEILTDLANEAYDYMVNGGLSQYEQALNSGMTAEEYGKQFFLQLIETLATGALSGAGMTGAVTAPSVIGNEIGAVAGDIARGEEIRKTGDTYTVLDKAKEQGGKVSKAADKISKKLYDDKGVSDRTLGRIERKTSEAAYKETKKEREADIDKILDNELSSLSRKEKNAVRSSVLTLLKNPLSIVYEQQEVLESENGKKALELMAKYYDIRKEAKAKNKKMASEEKNEATAKDISEHIRNDTTDELVKNTFSGKHKDGYEVGIGAVKSIKEGDFEVVQDRETGATALLSDVKIENEEADILYKTLRERVGAANRIPMTLEAVNVALSLYEPNINRDARMYALWAHDASIAATVGLSYKAFVSSFDGRHKNYITDFQMEQVYKAAAGNLVTKSGVTRIGGRHLSKMETEALFLIDRTFRKYGIHCVAIDGLTDENGHAVNALLTKKDVIVLNLNADGGLLSVAAGHELFHWLKKNDKNSAEYLQNLVIAMLKADKNVDFDALYKQRANVYTDLNENELLEEIAAQYFGVVFSSESNIRKVVNEANDAEKSILKKIIGRLKQFIAHIKATLREYAVKDKTVEAALNAEIKDLEELARKFDVALAEAGKNKNPAIDEGGVKYSKHINTKDQLFAQQLADWQNGYGKPFGTYNGHLFNLGKTSDILIKHGAKNAELVMYEDCLLKIAGNKHSIAIDELAKIPSQLDDPILLFVGSVPNSVVALTEIVDKNGNDVIVIVHINKRHKRNVINKIASVYSKSDEQGNNKIINYVKQQIDAGNLIDASIKKAPIWFTTRGLQLPKVVQTIIDANNTVPQKVQTVNNNDMQNKKNDTNKDEFSRQMSNTADNIEQLKTENESFAGYIDEVFQELQNKLKNKKQPDVVKIFDRKELYKIAAKYNTYYEPNKNGGFSKKQYSNTEIADIIENVLSEVSQGKTNVQDAVTRLTAIQENVLQNGYEIEYEPGAKEFRKELRNKPIYLTARDYNQLVEEFGGTRKALRAASYHQLSFKEAETAEGANISEIYNSLKERHPDFIGWAENDLEMARELISTERALRPKVHYASAALGFEGEIELEEAAVRRAIDILQEAFNVELVQTDFQRQYNELQKVRQSLNDVKRLNRNILENAALRHREREERNIIINRIQRNVNRFSDMIRNESDKRHIPADIKEDVQKFINLSVYTNSNGRPTFHQGDTLNMNSLHYAYKDILLSKDDEGKEISLPFYDQYIADAIEDLGKKYGNSLDIKQLNSEELIMADRIVGHISHIIKYKNDIFIDGRRQDAVKWSNEVLKEMDKHKQKDSYPFVLPGLNAEYGMLTPIYFFKNIATHYDGDSVIKERLFLMFDDIRKGQDNWYRNIEKTKRDIEEIKNEYHYDSAWNRDTKIFTLGSGERIKLTAEEILYMRALYIRENGHINHLNHLMQGGIIVESDTRLSTFRTKWEEIKETHEKRKNFEENKKAEVENIVKTMRVSVTASDLENIFNTLSDNMKGYGDALVRLLSTTGADLGNEVSLKLHGYKKFTENNYIPISVAADAVRELLDKREQNDTNIRLRNRSFTKQTVKEANATVYVRGITSIAAAHMQEMGLYNAMTIPIENLTRVYNYKKPDSEEFDSNGNKIVTTGETLKSIFRSIYGDRAAKYIENLIQDINGGNQTQARDFVSGMIGMFKRSAVTGSLSVAIQQPSAVVRACALVDAKYFVPGRNTREDYEEMMKYNPVAGIKEIGRFDTGIGQTATEWILDENNGFIDKADNFLMYLPGRMDRMTWTYIWKAVKRETKALNKELSGDKLLEKAAERFRDVIDYTQVYDSTIARSGYMRDQGGTAKMVTAFMAEPTLSYNLLRDAAKNFGNDWRQGLKSIAAFTGATILNALLKSMVTALRKDDDESNYFELYATDVIGNFFDDMNPLSLLPVVKDILNLAMGYDVERPDMTLFSNLINSGNVMWKRLQEGMTKEEIPVLLEELSVFIGAVSAFTKIPLNNLIKDLRGTFKTILGIKKSPDFSLNEVFNELKPAEDHVRCYDAIINKDDKFIERYLTPSDESINGFIKKGYSEEDAILKATDNAENNFHSKVVLGLISEDIRIREAADARLEADAAEYESILEELCEQGFDRNDVITAVNKYIASLDEPSYKKSEDSTVYQYTYDDLFNAIDKGNEASENAIYEYLRSNGAGQSSVQNKLKERYAEDVYNAVISKNEASYERYRKMFEEKYLYSIDKVLTYALEEYDGDIREAAESRYNLDFEEYQRIADSIIEKGFENTVVYGAIESAMNEFKPETPDKTYVAEPDYNYETEYADMHRAFEQNDLPKMKYVISELLESGVKASSIKKSLSGKYRDKYKEAWKNADIVTIERIRSILYSADVGYSESDFRKWEKAANDTQ